MYPEQFDYVRAESVDQALDLIDEYDDAKLLAGGQSLIPAMKTGPARPGTVIDISRIDTLSGINYDDDTIHIGANTTYADIIRNERLRDSSEVLVETVSHIGDIQVRNKGTIGGNLAYADPNSDLPAASLVADSTVVSKSQDGERRINVGDLFKGSHKTDLDTNELLLRVEIPRHGPDTASGYVKKANPASGYALIGVAAQLHTDGDIIESARVAANGAMDHGVRLPAVEETLSGAALNEDVLADAAKHAGDKLDASMMMDTKQASSEFRIQLLKVYTERVLKKVGKRSGLPVKN